MASSTVKGGPVSPLTKLNAVIELLELAEDQSQANLLQELHSTDGLSNLDRQKSLSKLRVDKES